MTITELKQYVISEARKRYDLETNPNEAPEDEEGDKDDFREPDDDETRRSNDYRTKAKEWGGMDENNSKEQSMKKMTITELKQYVLSEAKKLMKAEMLKEEKKRIVGQLKRLNEEDETKSYKFKVKHDKGSKTIKTTGSSESAAKKKIASAEGCPESAITLIKENEFGGDFDADSAGVEHGINPYGQEDNELNGEGESEEKFIPQGTYIVSNTGGYEIMLSDDGESARVRDAFGSDNPKTSDWLSIEYIPSEENGEMEPVIDPDGYNIPLNMVMRINR